MSTVPYVSPESATMYHALWYWATLQLRMGKPLTSSNDVCSQAALRGIVHRLNFEAKMATEQSNVNPPGVLKSLSKFREWWETFSNYMRSKRGAARIPLVYIFRKHTEVTDEMRARDDFESTDDEYTTLFALEGTYYQVDNKSVFHELNALVTGGPLESIVKKFERREDGRSAVLAILQYSNGDDAKMARTNQAMKLIQSTTFHRRSTNFTLDDYFSRLRTNFEILEANEEGLKDSMKISRMLEGITEPSLAMAKSVVLTQIKSTTNFEEVVTLLKTMAAVSMPMSQANPRQVSGLDKEKNRGGGKPSASSDKGTVKDSDVHAGTYSTSDWNKLTTKQQQKVRDERKKLSDKKRKTRAREEAATEKKDDSKESEDAATQDAGSQFGRDGSKSKKNKQG